MSGCKVDVERRGQYSNMYELSSKASFLSVKTSFAPLTSGVQNCGRMLEQMTQYETTPSQPFTAVSLPRIIVNVNEK